MSQAAGEESFDALQLIKDAHEDYMAGGVDDLLYIARVNLILDALRQREEGPTPEMVAHAQELSARLGLTGHS